MLNFVLSLCGVFVVSSIGMAVFFALAIVLNCVREKFLPFFKRIEMAMCGIDIDED